MFSQYGELRPTSSWDRLAGLGHPCKFQRASCLAFVTAPTSLNGGQPNFARCLAIFWVLYIHIHTFSGLLPLNWILLGVKFTLHPSLAFSYIGSLTARHLSSGHQPNFAVWYLHATGRPANFNGFRVLASLLHRRHSIFWALNIYIFWALALNWILPGVKFTWRPSLGFSYIGSLTARHLSSGRQPNFAAWYLHATGRPSRSTLGGRTV